MLTRRELMGTGLTAAAGTTGVSADTQSAAIDPRRVEDIVRLLGRIAGELEQANSGCSTGSCTAVGSIREAMTTFLRANGKFPDVMEVGPGIFYQVYDWHVRNRLALTVGRSGDGRYGLGFMFTRLLLRPDAQPEFMGLPYDLRA